MTSVYIRSRAKKQPTLCDYIERRELECNSTAYQTVIGSMGDIHEQQFSKLDETAFTSEPSKTM